MFLLIDNYDSFTYNLAQAFMSLGQNPTVLKNDDPALLSLAEDPKLEMVCISPGPGKPSEAGLCLQFLENLPSDVPVLGICLGHQVLGLYGGGNIEIAPTIMHGKQSDIEHDGSGMFKDIASPIRVGRYHSLVVKETPESKKIFGVTARGPQNEIMGLRYFDRPWYGVQFHPESVLTPDGMKFLGNFPDSLFARKELMPISQILDTLLSGKDMSREMAIQAFAQLMDGEMTPAQAGAFLTALHMKGESPAEIAQAIKTVIKRAIPIPGIEGDCIDIVGTGGDGKKSFNCSTAASLVVAGLGYKVAKHGNRAASSACGAADAIEGLGISLDKDPADIGKMLEKRNFAFLFAPHFHPSFKNIGSTRKEMGIPTLFNILGPMVNPAKPNHLLMGVAKPELVPIIANALAHSGIYKAAVVCGAGNYDELTTLGKTTVAFVENGKVTYQEIDPAEFGFSPCKEEDLACTTKEEAINSLKAILSGQGSTPMQDMVAINAGLAIFLLEENMPLQAAMQKAKNAVASGIGKKVLENA